MKEKKNKSLPGLDFSDEIKRLNRITGQMDGIRKMLENGRELTDILMQCKAIHSALKSLELRIFAIYAEGAVNAIARAEKKKDRNAQVEELLELYRQS